MGTNQANGRNPANTECLPTWKVVIRWWSLLTVISTDLKRVVVEKVEFQHIWEGSTTYVSPNDCD